MGSDQYGRTADLIHRYTITVLNDVDLVDVVKNLAHNLNGLLRVSIDAFYSTVSESSVYDYKGDVIATNLKYGIVYPNTWGSVNETELLVDENDLSDLLEELNPQVFETSLVKNTFHRRDVYTQSNVRLNRILAFQIVVTKLPPSWRHQ